jgi:flotillin
VWSAEANQQSKRAQAEYERQTTIVQAQLAAEVAVARAKANQDAAEAEQQSVRAQAEFSRQTQVVQAQYDSEVSVAKAKANQAAAQAEQESQRAQADFSRQTSIVRAKAKAEVDQAESQALQSGPLAQATAQRGVVAAQTELATDNAELRKQQLVAEIVKPAEAEAERIRVLAQADAQRTRIQAEAAASNNRVSLDQLLIEQLPQIVREAAQGLAKANVTVLNGSDGLGEIAAGLVSQGLAIFDSVRAGIGSAAPPVLDADQKAITTR